MKDKLKIFINQPFGIGDCIFLITIARQWIKEGHSITWGVFPQFLEGLQRAYPEIEWLDWQTVPIDYNNRNEHDSHGYRVVPMRWANEIMGESYNNCMRNKYDLLKLDYKTWKDNAMWLRDSKKEDDLFEKVYHFPVNYKLVNNNYQSDFKGKTNIPTGADCIDMRVIDDYSLFDWAKVLENASEIHTVSTSLLYLLEILDINCPIHLYPRPTDPKFKQVDYLFTKPYILH